VNESVDTDATGGVDDLLLQALSVHCAGRAVLVLEDDPAVGAAIKAGLGRAGCEPVVWVTDGLEAVAKAAEQRFDLLILDRNTPGVDGREALARIRSAEGGAPVPAMFVTALGADRQKLEGLMSGADDYLVKPVSEMDLLARSAALLRRATWDRTPGAVSDPDTIENGPMVLHLAGLEMTLAGKAVKLTGREYAILSLLARNLGLPVTRSMIWDRCWPEYNFQPEEFENRIDVHASRLRKRLETAADEAGLEVVPASARPLILSIRNQGLMLRKLRGAD
jgi:two-component system OmpR family response regulator